MRTRRKQCNGRALLCGWRFPGAERHFPERLGPERRLDEGAPRPKRASGANCGCRTLAPTKHRSTSRGLSGAALALRVRAACERALRGRIDLAGNALVQQLQLLQQRPSTRDRDGEQAIVEQGADAAEHLE